MLSNLKQQIQAEVSITIKDKIMSTLQDDAIKCSQIAN